VRRRVERPTIMYDPDECAELLKQYEDLIPKLRSPEVRARMIADGRDPEAVLKKLADQRDTLLAADAAAEKAEEHSLQAHADEADAMHAQFKGLLQAVREFKQANPLDPRVEEWEDFLEAWAEEMPKEPDDLSEPPR